MNFYFSFFSIVLLFSLFSMLGTKKKSGKIIICDECYYAGIFYVFLLFFLVSALRFEVGTDYIAYQNYAKKKILGIPFFQAVKDSEVFFILFSNMSYRLCGNMQLFYVIISFFIVFFTVKGILYYERNLFLPVIFFIISTSFFISLNAMRQMASFAIFLYASRFIMRRKFRKYFICILLALCWHTSAVLYFPCYFFTKIRIEKSFFPLVFLMFICKRILNLFIMNILNKLGLELAYYFVIQEGASSKFFIFISLLICICFFIFCRKEKGVVRNFFFNCLFVFLFLSIFGDGIPGSFRLIYLFMPMTVVVCPYIYHKAGKSCFVPLVLFIIIFSLFFYKNHIFQNVHGVVPYKSILGNIL